VCATVSLTISELRTRYLVDTHVVLALIRSWQWKHESLVEYGCLLGCCAL
jgi:hypothetical protein